ncbi:MAG: HAMP domain-containing histidine kinase [Butyrivibrio sp.]|nr:HAMP domain-containing histidine kinase [Butyrivibrio sp.]
MVKKLRRKFVITATSSLLVILIVMMAVINISNYVGLIKNADNLLSILTTNDGHFPGMINMERPSDLGIPGEGASIPDFSPNGASSDSSHEPMDPSLDSSQEFSHDPAQNDRQNNPNIPFGFDRLNNTRSAEMPYQSRYFVVRFDNSGAITSTDLMHVAAITSEDATEYASEVYSSNKEKGMYHSYRYKRVNNDDGTTLLVFVDLSSSILDAYTLLFRSLLVGALALIAMFILVYMFSSQAVAPVVESLEKQKRFITDAGHELKTPLAVISANVDVLELESGKNEWTGSIRNQIKRMNALVKNLLTLSRMDEERMHVVFSDFDLSKTVLESGTSFQALAESKNKKYQLDIEEGIHITGDKNAINQLTSLLLDNAMKYSSENGYIHLVLAKDKNITLEVSNTCDYIPEGNLDRLFDRFYRADSSRSRDTGGYGIGLSVARAIAQSHGGTIEALRDGDKIIRFVVTLPRQLPKSIQKQNQPAK